MPRFSLIDSTNNSATFVNLTLKTNPSVDHSDPETAIFYLRRHRHSKNRYSPEHVFSLFFAHHLTPPSAPRPLGWYAGVWGGVYRYRGTETRPMSRGVWGVGGVGVGVSWAAVKQTDPTLVSCES
jgi:hypothetical protein